MEPILVYGFPAGSSLGLIASLEWLGSPYRLARVDMLGEMQRPEFGRINRQHETPVFVTDQGRVLTETMAIATWLAARDTERRISYPPLTAEADRMWQLLAFINSSFAPAFTSLWAAWEGQMPEADKVALRSFGSDRVHLRMDQLERMLGDDGYAVGDRVTLADGVFIGVARWADLHQIVDPARWPRIAELRSTLEQDPAVAFATAIEEGEVPQVSKAFAGHVDLSEVILTFGEDD